MIDVMTRRPLRISTDGDAGPYIIAPVSQLEQVRRLLEDHRIRHWVDEEAISLDGKPEVVFINLGLGTDAVNAQALLDAIP